MKVQRHTQILDRVRADGSASVTNLSSALEVSPSTIRRDLLRLDRTGVLTRVHGGAALAANRLEDPDTTSPFAAVAQAHTPEKSAVVTNSLAALDELRDDEAVELILLGGLVRRSYHSLVGVLTEDAVRQIGVDRAFIGTSGIAKRGEVMDTTFVEVPVKRALIAAARQVVVVADGHKIPGTGTMRVCACTSVDVLVTTGEADETILSRCREHLTDVVLA